MSENNHRKQSLTYGQRLESGPVRQRPCAPCWSQWPWEAHKQRWIAGLPYLSSEVPSTKSTWFPIVPGFYPLLSSPWETYTWKRDLILRPTICTVPKVFNFICNPTCQSRPFQA